MTAETQSGCRPSVEALEEAYGDLVWTGWCCWAIGPTGWNADHDDPDEMARAAFVTPIRERALADGLRIYDKVVFDRSYGIPEIGEWSVLIRLALPDGTLPPDPASHLVQRRELRARVESAWGDVLARARDGHEARPTEPRESRVEWQAAMTRYLTSSYPRRLWTDVRRRMQRERPLGRFGRRW